ncbi:MAG: Methionine-tRNA ligase [Parcubacteria group bacterium GW2011_GWC1_38_6]|nr:MAG: Methionine-tRNA ligase [Parcubacteria group bacterium GW2011_GWA1_36_12]KKQ76241.1 MAG: Methionine-tRNA ligase [Parcubacteria group bacterium GW2011_GWC1_38_6]
MKKNFYFSKKNKVFERPAKGFYLTTSIAYTNAPPHLGFALELIQTDVVARYNRILGKKVFFLTGTDEHGVKVAKAAAKYGKTPKEFVDTISDKFKSLKPLLNISNNDFIRTTDQKKHWPVVKKIWLKLQKNGDIYKKKYQGLYCSGCEAFITQKDLKDGKCVLHQKEPEKVEEENYFFRLSKYTKKIKDLIAKDKLKIIPSSKKKEMLTFLENGLEDISFSRPRKDLKWGIPVPGDDTQTIYVWADALTNYISAIGYGTAKFKQWWPADIHFVGKDILKFHSLIWPGILLSLKLPLPKTIFVHGFINVDGQKMSKSLGNVINPLELVKKYGVDPVRYFLLRELPPTEDGDFTYEKFEERYNADLAKGLGNLVSRTISLSSKLSIKPKTTISNPKLKMIINKINKNYKKSIEEFRFNNALAEIWELVGFCDRYIDTKKPWQESKEQKEIIGNLLFAISEIAKLLEPFLPETTEKTTKQLRNNKYYSLFPRIVR